MGENRIVIAHGGGGVLARDLVETVFIPLLGGPPGGLQDAASVPAAEDIIFTTDSFVVKPLFFPGGDIGSLSVYGTVNDLGVSGAVPLALSMSLIIEEGFDINVLREVVGSAARAAQACGVKIITGDTKVVARGEADQLFITTAGVGQRRINVHPGSIRPGDRILINGPIAEHGIAVMSEREGIHFRTAVRSDSGSVWPCVEALIEGYVEIHAMRDPTRGGLAACCVELANDSGVTISLDEPAIPVRREVRCACELLGLDPLTVANEGKLVAFVPETDASKAVEILRRVPGGEDAAVIGSVVERRAVAAYMRTRHGGERIVEMPYGEELPRIC